MNSTTKKLHYELDAQGHLQLNKEENYAVFLGHLNKMAARSLSGLSNSPSEFIIKPNGVELMFRPYKQAIPNAGEKVFLEVTTPSERPAFVDDFVRLYDGSFIPESSLTESPVDPVKYLNDLIIQKKYEK